MINEICYFFLHHLLFVILVIVPAFMVLLFLLGSRGAGGAEDFTCLAPPCPRNPRKK